ncbi:1990_t:CDS:2, partial [Ambispora leptoticha]
MKVNKMEENGSSDNKYGEKTSFCTTELQLPTEFSSIERVCLTADGNLQRILSAWFNDKVMIKIIRNKKVGVSSNNNLEDQTQKKGIHPEETRKKLKMNNASSVNIYQSISSNFSSGVSQLIQQHQLKRPLLGRVDREVDLCCKGKVVCNALSNLLIYDEKIDEVLNEHEIGIAQIFRYFNKHPDFQLLSIGRSDTIWWREYSLRIEGIDCYIKETFPKNLFKEGWIDDDNLPDDFFDKECTRNVVSWEYYSSTFK